MKDFVQSSKIKVFQFVIIIAYFLQINSKNISNCTREDGLKTVTCFNDLIDIKQCRAGQFAEDKNQNMFVLYSSSSSNSSNESARVFFGLKKDGTNYFGYNAQKDIFIYPDGNATERKESRIIFVSPYGDKEYLFSTSAGEPNLTLVELYNIESNTITSSLKSMEEFWNIDSEEITSYQYSLVKEPYANNYFLAFAQQKNLQIIKFKFESQNLESLNIMQRITLNSNYNYRTINCFMMEQNHFIVLFYMKNKDNTGLYTIKLYSSNLVFISEQEGFIKKEPIPGRNAFFKGLWIKDNYASFIYWIGRNGHYIGRFNISSLINEGGTFKFKNIKQSHLGSSEINNNFETNEFIKINDERLVFVTTKLNLASYYPDKLAIILFDLYEN